MAKAITSSTRPINYPAVATALDLGYRLNVAINVVNHRLESWRWLVDWFDNIRDSIKELILTTSPTSMGDDRTQLLAKYAIDVYASTGQDALCLGSQASQYNESDILDQAVLGLLEIQKQLLRSIRCSIDYGHGSTELLIAWFLGEQLAFSDMNCFSKYVDDRKLKLMFSPELLRVKRNDKSFNIFHEFNNSDLWLSVDSFFDVLNMQIKDQKAFPRDGSTFTSGGIITLLKAIWHPQFYAPVIWVIPQIKGKGLLLLYAGRCFALPGRITLKNDRDCKLNELLHIMAEDMLNKKPLDDCGWVMRKVLFGTSKQDTINKAWKVIEELAAPIGGLEFVPTNTVEGISHPYRGCGRVSGLLGRYNCRMVTVRKKN